MASDIVSQTEKIRIGLQCLVSILVSISILDHAHAQSFSSAPAEQTVTLPLRCEKIADPDATKQVCAEWAKEPALISRFSDGSILPNPVLVTADPLPNELHSINRDILSDRETAMRSDVDSLIQSMIEQVRGQTPLDRLSENQKYLVDRLRAVTVSISFGGNCRYALNAGYESETNTLLICPLLTRLPAPAYLPVLAHELGHLADPCNYDDVFRYSSQLLALSESERAAAFGVQVDSCLASETSEDRGLVKSLTRRFANVPGIALSVSARGPLRAIVEKLKVCGVLTAPSLPAPTTYSGHPFLPVLTCVTSHYPKIENSADLPEKFRSREVPRPVPVGPTTVISDSNPACDSFFGQSKEATADNFAALILNYHVNRVRPSISPEQRPWLRYFDSLVSCGHDDQESFGYPRSSERTRAFIQMDIVRESAGCAEPVASLCGDAIRQNAVILGSGNTTTRARVTPSGTGSAR